jgi:replicative DNA helicase
MLEDIAVERAVLSGICQYGCDAYIDVCDIISVNTFTFDSNQVYYRCIEHIFKQNSYVKLDAPSIWSAANELGLSHIVSKTDEKQYLGGLFRFPIKQENIRRLAGKLRKLEIARQLENEVDDIKANIHKIKGDESISAILGIVENPIFQFTSKLANDDNSGPKLMGEGVEEYVKYLAENQVEMTGVSTGFPILDSLIGGGLQVGVNLFGARPKIGKTTLADNMALYIAMKLGIPVINVDTEMNKKDHWNRILANLTGVTVDKIKTGKFANSAEEKAKVDAAAKLLAGLPYSYDCVVGLPFDDILGRIRRWVLKKVGFQSTGIANPCAVIFDYLKLSSGDNLRESQKEYQLLGFQINDLHNLMAKYEIPCAGMIQLNRDGIDKEETSVLSGSDRQAWTCVNLCIFKKKSDVEQAEDSGKTKYNRKMVHVVGRFGPGLEDPHDFINMNMYGQFAKIEEGPTRNQAEKLKVKGEIIHDANEIPADAKQF